MQRTLVAALCSLLVSSPVLADESPTASAAARAAPTEPASALAGATSDATLSTATAPTEAATTRESRPAPAVNPASKTDATPVKQVQLNALDDRTVCRKEEQTGSRIAVKRCYSTAETAASKVQRDITRRDIEEMRDRQMYEQLRRASMMTIPTGMVPR